jgi:putative flavoprotein involved in K+ transport
VSRRIDTVVIGAGQAGLAVSRCLTERSVEHVVLERGRIAERWRTERWDSLRLLTPNWMSRLPGWPYAGAEPHGFMTASEVVSYFDSYARASMAPVEEDSEVEHLGLADDGFVVVTPRSRWCAVNVVLATGWCDRPAVPAAARGLHPAIGQTTPGAYRNPDALPAGGVLVVGASAAGVQLAWELAQAGRDVVLAVGNHSRVPRSYRGMDIFWWLERLGRLDRTIDEVPDPAAARREPSLQLAGRPDHLSLDLDILRGAGVEVTGRLRRADGRRVGFARDLHRTVETAEARLRRLLGEIDAHIEAAGLTTEVLDADPPPPIAAVQQLDDLDLDDRGMTTVLWATGYRRAYPWLHVPVLDASGEIGQRRGRTGVPGLYVLGQRFQHCRNSNFIDGVGRDAIAVADHLVRRTTAPSRA